MTNRLPWWRWRKGDRSDPPIEFRPQTVIGEIADNVYYMSDFAPDAHDPSSYVASVAGQGHLDPTRFSATYRPVGRMKRWIAQYITMPPIIRFAQIDTETRVSGPLKGIHFWIQPTVYEASGQIMRGFPRYTDDGLHAVNIHGDILHTPIIHQAVPYDYTAETIEQIKVALDSFLQTGIPDPRFL